MRAVVLQAMLVLLGCGPAVALAAPESSAGGPDPRVVAALYAKVMCSALFISGLQEAQVRSEDLAGFPALPIQVDRQKREVTAQAAQVERTATYHEGFGCTVRSLGGADPQLGSDVAPKFYGQQPEEAAHRWRRLQRKLSSPVQKVLAQGFIESDPERLKRTRALLVLQHNRIIGEQYAPGITPNTPLPGYSMAKGIALLLVGMLQQRGWLALTDRDLLPQWRIEASDPRREIQLGHLLRMTSGLEWTESYDGSDSDLMSMLTLVPSASQYAASKPMALQPDSAQVPDRSSLPLQPGQFWRYSGGSYEIVSGILRSVIESRGQDYPRFPYEQLFRVAGMTSAQLEAGPDGTYLLSAFALATARDWSRLGQLILNEYSSHARHILPAGWIQRSVRQTSLDADNSTVGYGAAFWLKPLGAGVPRDTFYLAGLEGQFLAVVPSRDLVVVRLATTPIDGDWTLRPLMVDLMKVTAPARMQAARAVARRPRPDVASRKMSQPAAG